MCRILKKYMNAHKLNRQAGGLLVGYGLQFVAGMLLNLFVTIPATHPGDSGNEYFSRSAHSLVWALSTHGGWELAFHAWLALILVLGSISLFISSLVAHHKRWIVWSLIAALFTIGAFFNGLSFVDFNHDISSLIMALCWLVAVSSLTIGLVTARPHQ